MRPTAGGGQQVGFPPKFSGAAWRRNAGNAYFEAAAAVGAFAHRDHRAAVQLHQPSHEREAHPEAALTPGRTAVTLDEEIEDALEHVGVDADAVIAYHEQRLLAFRCNLH